MWTGIYLVPRYRLRKLSIISRALLSNRGLTRGDTWTSRTNLLWHTIAKKCVDGAINLHRGLANCKCVLDPGTPKDILSGTVGVTVVSECRCTVLQGLLTISVTLGLLDRVYR